MKAVVPLFRENIEWRRLTKEERGKKPWKYILLKDVFFEVETGVDRHYDCCGKDGKVWVVIVPHGIIMKKGYAWNGNTASPDSLFGICLLIPSLPHDGLFQFSGSLGFPRNVITLNWTNCLYFALADKRLAWAYYAGLAVGSWYVWCSPPKNGDHVVSKPLHFPEPT